MRILRPARAIIRPLDLGLIPRLVTVRALTGVPWDSMIVLTGIDEFDAGWYAGDKVRELFDQVYVEFRGFLGRFRRDAALALYLALVEWQGQWEIRKGGDLDKG